MPANRLDSQSGRNPAWHPSLRDVTGVKPTTTSIQDPANPTDAELRQWAFSDELGPMQDFDLMVADLQRLPLVLELASSPRRAFFVHCFHLAVGVAAQKDFYKRTPR